MVKQVPRAAAVGPDSRFINKLMGWAMAVSQEAWIFVVDDDRHFLDALKGLLSAKGYRVAAFTSPVQFLERHDPKLHGCLLLDMQMSELSGLEVQAELAALGQSRPVIFLTGTDQVETAVSAMKGGAINYLIKPVDADVVLAAVQSAIEEDKAYWERRIEQSALMGRWRRLSRREQDVFWHVADGQLNKQTAYDLRITEKTVKVHRARVMKKLRAGSAAALARMAEHLPRPIERALWRNILPMAGVGSGHPREAGIDGPFRDGLGTGIRTG
jgi:FixJ family two-component response regulator